MGAFVIPYPCKTNVFFWGGGNTGISLFVHLSVHVPVRVSVCVQNTTFCQSTGGDIMSVSDGSSLLLVILYTFRKGFRHLIKGFYYVQA